MKCPISMPIVKTRSYTNHVNQFATILTVPDRYRQCPMFSPYALVRMHTLTSPGVTLAAAPILFAHALGPCYTEIACGMPPAVAISGPPLAVDHKHMKPSHKSSTQFQRNNLYQCNPTWFVIFANSDVMRSVVL